MFAGNDNANSDARVDGQLLESHGACSTLSQTLLLQQQLPVTCVTE